MEIIRILEGNSLHHLADVNKQVQLLAHMKVLQLLVRATFNYRHRNSRTPYSEDSQMGNILMTARFTLQ